MCSFCFIVLESPWTMAASAGKLGQSSEKADITLTEDDIPGVLLRSTLFQCYVRWWLLCRGVTVSTSLKKAKIIEK